MLVLPSGMPEIWHVCRRSPTFNLVLSTRNVHSRNVHSMHSHAHVFTRSSIYFQQVPKHGLLGRRLSICKSLQEGRHLEPSRRLPRVMNVWTVNSSESWQRYGTKGTQGASLLCPFLTLLRAASQEAWKMRQHLLGRWWTCCLPGPFSVGLKLCCLEWSACLLVIDVSSNVIYWADTVRAFVSTKAHEDSALVYRAAFFTRSWLSTGHRSSWELT